MLTTKTNLKKGVKIKFDNFKTEIYQIHKNVKIQRNCNWQNSIRFSGILRLQKRRIRVRRRVQTNQTQNQRHERIRFHFGFGRSEQ